MVAAFLLAELDSPRYRDQVLALLAADGKDASVVVQPNVEDVAENAYRDSLLDRYRAWTRREGLFNGFPHDVEWFRVALTRDEVLSILYIDWDWWLTISGGTRRPLDAARRIRSGDVPAATVEGNEAIAARPLAGDDRELIVVAPRDYSRLVVLEGHVRLTAYALFPDALPAELEILLGVSDEIAGWSNF
jgi:hypothetical protein